MHILLKFIPENRNLFQRILKNLGKNELVNHFIVLGGEIYVAFIETFVHIFLVTFVEKMLFLGILEQYFHIINTLCHALSSAS